MGVSLAPGPGACAERDTRQRQYEDAWRTATTGATHRKLTRSSRGSSGGERSSDPRLRGRL